MINFWVYSDLGEPMILVLLIKKEDFQGLNHLWRHYLKLVTVDFLILILQYASLHLSKILRFG